MFRIPAAAVLAAAVSLAPVFGQGASAQAPKPMVPESAAADPVVALVDGVEIKRSELEAIQAGLPDQYRAIPLAQIFESLLKEVIDRKLAAKAALGAKLDEDPTVKARIDFDRERILRSVYIERELDKRLSDDVLRARYEEFSKAAPSEEEVRARHILMKTREDAEAVIKELAGGADFETLAKSKSTGPSGPTGGDLGYFTRERMVKPFADAAFEMKPGESSKTPVQTQFGYHVILVVDRRMSKPPSFADVRDELKQAMAQQMEAAIAEELRLKATIQQFNIDGSQRIEQRLAPLPSGIQPVPRQ